MGIVGWFKKKMNIGGLKLKIVSLEPITADEGWVQGMLAMSAKDVVVAPLTYRLICETTTGSGDQKKTSTTVLGEMTVEIGVALDNEDKTEQLTFPYDMRNWFEKKGGVLGAASKAFSFVKGAVSEESRDEYFVEVSAKVPGVWNTPGDKKPITVALAR